MVHPSSRRVIVDERYHDDDDDDPLLLLNLRNIRGGATKVATVEEDEVEVVSNNPGDGLLVSQLRSLAKTLLKVTDKSPNLKAIVKQFFLVLERLIGTSLLPRRSPTRKKKKSRTKKRKEEEEVTTTTSSKKRRRKRSSCSKVASSSTGDDESDESTTTTKPKKKKKNKTSTLSKSKAGLSTATKKHLNTSLKSTSPNYRIQQELKHFLKSPPQHLEVKVGTNLRIWIVEMTGAPNTVYEGEVYKLRIAFPPQYPTVPPSVYFLQPTPKHEHVYTNGDICLSLLGKDWRPTMTAQSIAVSILSILSSAKAKSIPMDNARHAQNKPGKYQKDWIYHDDNC